MNLESFKAMQAESKVEPSKVETVVEQPVTAPLPVVETVVVKEPELYDIGGKKVTIDELQKGYLRQSDYTKKTTEISQLKKEHKEALDLYNLVQSNPELQAKLKEGNVSSAVINSASAENKRIRDLETKIATMELDNEINNLKAKYPDFNDALVIQEAAKRGTTDLEFVYKATRNVKEVDETVDREALKKELLEEIKREMKEPEIPGTIITSKSSAKPIQSDNGPTMSSREARIADAMGMTHMEYIKYRDAK